MSVFKFGEIINFTAGKCFRANITRFRLFSQLETFSELIFLENSVETTLLQLVFLRNIIEHEHEITRQLRLNLNLVKIFFVILAIARNFARVKIDCIMYLN